MKVTINSNKTRTLVPVVVDVQNTDFEPTLTVEPLDQNSPVESFQVDFEELGDRMQAQFWFEQPGNYKLITDNGQTLISETIQVSEQEFMSFNLEFGLFSSLLMITLLGIVVWHKKRTQRLTTKN